MSDGLTAIGYQILDSGFRACYRVIERAGNGPLSDGESAPDRTGFGAANCLALRRRDIITPQEATYAKVRESFNLGGDSIV